MSLPGGSVRGEIIPGCQWLEQHQSIMRQRYEVFGQLSFYSLSLVAAA
jgi:hypothetical protein